MTDRNPGLDGLRALAVCLVLGYHFFPGAVPNGYLGVDMFFVLSGFFIARQVGHPGAEVAGYLVRRVLRLLPMILTVILATLAAGALTLLPEDYARLGRDSLVGISLTTNIFPPVSEGYFAPGAQDMPLLHLWSLGVEMQIYLGAALLLPLMTRVIPLRLVMLILFAASLAYVRLILNPAGETGFFAPGARLWEFALGGLFATLVPQGTRHVGYALAAGLAAASLLPLPAFAHPGVVTYAAAMATALLLSSLRAETGSVLGLAPFSFLGRISYSLYLWHWPILVLWTSASLSVTTPLERAGLILLSVCLSVLSYLLIERPFLAWGRLSLRLPALGSIVLLAAASGFAVMISLGASQRLPETTRSILAEIRPAHDRAQSCHSYRTRILPVEQACRHNETRGEIQTAVLGDSHSMVLSGGLVRMGLPFVEYSFSGCAPTSDFYPMTHGPACAEWMEKAIASIKDDPAIETVIIAARWAFYTQPRFDNGRGGRDVHDDVIMISRANGQPVSDLRVRAALRATILDLLESGRNVLLYYPGPAFGWDIRKALAMADWKGRRIALSVPRAMIDERQAGMRLMLDKIEGEKLARFDPLEIFCNKDLCRPIGQDGTTLLYDQDHLSSEGADLVARGILEKMREEGWPAIP